MTDDPPKHPAAARRLMKVPALNVVHVCGVVTVAPRALSAENQPTGTLFEISARTYERGRKATLTDIVVVCWGQLAEATVDRLGVGDIVLIAGALHNRHRQLSQPLQVIASAIQFLTDAGSQTT